MDAFTLVLSGHVHKNVEYRIEKAGKSGCRFFMDFYTETPGDYYSRKSGLRENIHIAVRKGASFTGRQSTVNNHTSHFSAKKWKKLTMPAYAEPLAEATDLRRWWQRHAPLLIQTSCTGAADGSHRELKEPKPSFRGYRIIGIRQGAITSVAYHRIGFEAGRTSPTTRPPRPRPDLAAASRGRRRNALFVLWRTSRDQKPMLAPPSIGSTAPVTNLAAGEQR